MKLTKFVVGGVISVIGVLGFATYGLPVTLASFSSATINLTPPANGKQPAQVLPKPLETKVLETLRVRLGRPQNFLPMLKVIQSEPATWQDCLPNAQGEIPLNQPCQAKARSGWRVSVAALGQTWVHYVTNDGFITLDAPSSINQQVRSQIAKQLTAPPANLRIAAAELTKQACPINAKCAPAYGLGWRVLVDGRLFHLDLQGQEVSRGFVFRENQAGLPGNVQTQIVRDVVDRHGGMAANLRVESIKATTWNWCRGGSGAGPTPPEMGACPDINQAGWQMIVRSGPLRYVYYPTRHTGTTAFLPDGMQSIPPAATNLVGKLAAQQAKVNSPSLRIHRVEPQFFDRCLSVNNESLHCRQGIQAGWQVMALGGKTLENGAIPAWVYHVSLLGDRATFARSGSWLPVPSAPPPR